MVRNVSVASFEEHFIGKRIRDISRYGKHLLFEIDDFVLISHLRMEGKYYIKNVDHPRDKHEHVIFYFTDGSTLRYHDTRKFGTFDIVSKDQLYVNSPLTHLGYEPGSSLLTVPYLQSKMNHKTLAVKPALLDQHIICGLGNIYVDEVLFICRIHPETRCCDLTNHDYKNIIEASEKVIEKAIQLGGTTIRSYTATLGVTGRFQNELLVHTKQGEPCTICGTPITKIKVAGRGTYLCESCQKRM